MDLIATNLLAIRENSNVDEVSDSKVNNAKIVTKTAKFKSQDKIKVKTWLKF